MSRDPGDVLSLVGMEERLEVDVLDDGRLVFEVFELVRHEGSIIMCALVSSAD